MTHSPDPDHWTSYNAAQAGRGVRPLCADVLALAGLGGGRHALDLGCGAGIETRAMLEAGWRVTAVDAAATTGEMVGATVGGPRPHPELVVVTARLEEVTLPEADLVHAGYSLPYVAARDWPRLAAAVVGAVRPGGWFAANVFGVRDGWAGTPGMTFLSRAEVDSLLEGLEVHRLDEVEEDGRAFSGPKHWHVYDVLARRPG